MQQPINFENQIVQPKNLNFLNASMEKNIKDIVTLLTDGDPGIGSGLTLTGISGNNYFTVTTGYGFLGDGERVQIYSGTNVPISFTGLSDVYIKLQEVSYNPDPSENPAGAANIVTNIDPTDSTLEAVEQYNVAAVSLASGVGYIKIGNVNADTSMLFTEASASGAQYLAIGGIINLENNTINGVNIGSGTIDSNLFANPLTFDINLGSDVDLILGGSGNSNIGSSNTPLANIYAVTGNFHELTGMSPILTDTFLQKTGTSLEATGNNTVQIDRSQLGTQFGMGLTLNTNSISTVGVDQDINITAAQFKTINLNSPVDVALGNTFVVKGDLIVSGTTTIGTINLAGVTGNFAVNGEISYNSTSEFADNIVRNSNFAIPSGNITGTAMYPANWSTTEANTDYGFGPTIAPTQWLRPPAALTTQMAVLGTTGNYTFEATFKKFGNPADGGPNYIWTKFSTNTNLSMRMNISTANPSTLVIGTNNVNLATSAVINNNQWYHVAYTWDGTTRKLWIDGVVAGSDTQNGSFQGGDISDQRIFSLGSDTAPNGNFNGIISNLAVSNVAKTIFPSGGGAIVPNADPNNTMGYWKFEKNLLDSGPNGRTLVAHGSVPTSYSETRLGQAFSGTVAGTGTDTSLSPATQNVYIGTPHTSNFMLCSGINIDPTGIYINQPLPDLKLNTPYNISYFMKGYGLGASGLAINPTISGTVAGLPSITTLITSPNAISNNDWLRQSFNFTTPATGSNFNLSIGAKTVLSTGTVSTGIFGLTAVQITEGPAIVPYNKHEKINQILITDASFSVVHAWPNATTYTMPAFTRTFYTKGGFCMVNANPDLSATRQNASFYQDLSFGLYLTLDGRDMAESMNTLPYSMAGTIGQNYAYRGHANMSFCTYLEPGFHTLQTRLHGSVTGGAYGGNWTFTSSATTPFNISITIFE